MPQNPLAVNSATKSGAYASQRLDTTNNLLVANGLSSSLNITTATLVKAGAGRIVRVVVTTAGAAGTVNDAATTGAAAAANLIATIPATIGTYYLDFPVTNGIVISPGAAQVVSVSYV